ncbi:hypothetical protein GCM10027049_25990 [Mucilaginibacter puniceus]
MKTIKVLLLLTLTFAGLNNAKADQPALNVAFNKFINTYLDIKNALVAGDVTAAQAKAKGMVTLINAIPQKDLDAAQRKAWTAYSNKISSDAQQIGAQNNIDAKREHFATLSNNFMAVMKVFKMNKATLYQQYCPMKKFYWLSETSAIKNPYYGNTMLTCGTTQETFEAVK